jgi:hypothetical protein
LSLITALVINSIAIAYVSTEFRDTFDQYKLDGTKRDIVNNVQEQYECCGVNTWLDWSRMKLYNITSQPNSSTIATATTLLSATSKSWYRTNSLTSSFNETLFDSFLDRELQDSSVIIINRPWMDELQPAEQNQDRSSSSDNYFGLPTSLVVVLPLSCCLNKRSNVSTRNKLCKLSVSVINTKAHVSFEISFEDCLSIVQNVTTRFFIDGCARKLGQSSVGVTLGLVIINAFLIFASALVLPTISRATQSSVNAPIRFIDESTTPDSYPIENHNLSVSNQNIIS